MSGKRIIICCDGTWNSPEDEHERSSGPTNVIKLSRAILPFDDKSQKHQITYYLAGVGTGGLLDKIKGGAFGEGLSANIKDAYLFLINNYREGDELWFFGFSRGAYTARSLIGLIKNSGLLKKEYASSLDEAYDLYRGRSNATRPNSATAKAFKEQYGWQPDITFLGVWDTVGSVGIPDYILSHLLKDRWNFHDVQLSSIVQNAYHAVSIDEERGDFKPSLWEKDPDNHNPNQVMEEVWFSGAHSDVGGGYPEKEAGLSNIALKWVIQKASHVGLVFDSNFVNKIKEDLCSEPHDSVTGFFKARQKELRPLPPRALIHRSVLERMENKKINYKPENLSGRRTQETGNPYPDTFMLIP